MAIYSENDIEWSKFAVVVKQMSSDNPHIRALALESLDRMVEADVMKRKNEIEKHPVKTHDVLQRIRLVQYEKTAQLQRRKKWFNMV
ncbi:hypothetical protein [Halalkalibacter urbisdiaboli]|uniref:hypothetical protein n=1 Tax=Halalkalibacter urbisdiaboli TaxID=1960589 RepID=UPI000B44DCDC|nr:hypothetical protein [Halalkalibacter urbisdiaboli]